MKLTSQMCPLVTRVAEIFVPSLLVAIMATMVMEQIDVLGPFLGVALIGGFAAGVAISIHNRRSGYILLQICERTKKSEPSPDIGDDAGRFPISHKAVWLRRKSSNCAVPSEVEQTETFDPRPAAFELRWSRNVGSYSNSIRSGTGNKEFRNRVYRELEMYVNAGLDTLALCDLVSKSVAFTAAECAEIIEDLVKTL